VNEKVVIVAALVALVLWVRRPAPAIATVATSSQWFDPVSGEWRDF